MSLRGHKLLVITAVVGAGLVAVLGFIIFDAIVLEPNMVTVQTVEIDHPGLARALAGHTIVQISDLHLKERLGVRERLLGDRVRSLKADLVLITGDLVEESRAAPLVSELVRRFHPRLWTYGVLGNSDRTFLQGGTYKERGKRAGLSLIGGRSLRMQVRDDGSDFWLVGIDFPGYGVSVDEKLIEELFRPIPSSSAVIALSYSPDLAPLLIEAGADLVLSGDTHGGQVVFPGSVFLFQELGRSKFIRGLYRFGSSFLYVNRGIGTKGWPVRFLCPPEITVFRFE